MDDRLVWLLERFELRARVFQAGAFRCGGTNPARPGIGYLHIVERGRVRLTSQDAGRLEIDEPTAFFYMNPEEHRIDPLDPDTSLVCATFEFGLGEGNPLQRALPGLVVVRLADAPELAATLQQLFAEADGDHCGRQAVIDRLSEVALILILRGLMDQDRLDVGLLAGLADPRLRRAINAIHADPARQWTLASLAQSAGMSRARFAARFRDVVGMTPGDYLSEWRLGLAQSMLLRGKPVKFIAAEIGYGSASALSRVFSARCGISPRQWVNRRSAGIENL